MNKYAIYSCEGFTREVIPSLRRQLSALPDDIDADAIVCVDDNPARVGDIVQGCRVIGFDELKADPSRLVNVCIADPWVRQKVTRKCAAAGFEFFSIADASHLRFDNSTVGEGAVFCANTMLTGDLVIGRHFHCNIYSYIAHDCRIGDFVTFAPRVSCNGRVVVDDFAYIGTGAMFKQGSHDAPLHIGRGAVVGMGAVVTKDVPDGAVVVGNPAKVIKTLDLEEKE